MGTHPCYFRDLVCQRLSFNSGQCDTTYVHDEGQKGLVNTNGGMQTSIMGKPGMINFPFMCLIVTVLISLQFIKELNYRL